ncbi:MAG: ROK family transcriptional regulator, partial [Chloroflexi bacterium]|nr:ROK family transcriptional regulator [Chloroflexota bacterium]
HASMQQANEAAILDHVRRHGSVSRSDVARDLGLSPATVSRAVRRLLHAGALREVGLGLPTLGRPPTLLEYDRRQGFVIAVDVGGTLCRAVLADLEGEELHAVVVPTHQAGQTPLEGVYGAVGEVLDHARGLRSRVAALGVGVPGVVTHPDGVVTRCPSVGWDGMAVGRLLEERFHIPAVVENDVNLAALGEAWRGAAQGMADFAVIAIGTGIGAGLVVGGELLHGRHHAAGEVGYLVPGAEYLSQPIGERGCLESLASGPGVAARAADLLQVDPRPSSLRALGRVRAEDVFRLWQAGDPVAAAAVDEFADRMALLAIGIATILDPEIIIFGGSVGLAAERILPRITARVSGRVPALPILAVSTLGGRATLLGATSAALALARTVESGRAGLAAQARPRPDASVGLAVRSIKTRG